MYLSIYLSIYMSIIYYLPPDPAGTGPTPPMLAKTWPSGSSPPRGRGVAKTKTKNRLKAQLV